MFRKLLPTVVLAVVTLTGWAATASTADAGAPTILPHHRFEVLATRGGKWTSHGVYHLHARAEVVAIRLRLEGYRVEIRQF
ncbi:hypothetical protein GobsT_61390 [Gemmata obscuriglobus]|nr:hypothetical protein [Gemmata obscuriglobus]QEG31318.1 hypothetical protein GobsT_61390 [Gemmata obscuriglobus]VTS10657.1 unnamed protein product [Gemmata obscuriglobus UQM 2246]